MKIVNIIGGLGNQMWQYAMLIALKEKFPNEEVFYDASFFNGYSLHNGFELDRIFNITAKQAKVRDIRRLYHYFIGRYFFLKVYTHYLPTAKCEIREARIRPFNREYLEWKGDAYYKGYWADHRYFDNCRDLLLKEFTLKEPIDKRNRELLDNLKEKYLCCIHVRRGDYLNSMDFKGICGIDYYERAIKEVRNRVDSAITFLIFSNDIKWCMENLHFFFGVNEVIYVDWNIGRNSYKDMFLMSRCQANIIANSSFSWWGAYLNENPNKIVVSPMKYKNTDVSFNISLDDWICI